MGGHGGVGGVVVMVRMPFFVFVEGVLFNKKNSG